MIASTLLAEETEDLVRVAIDMAKAGDKDMLKFLLGRTLPKERAVKLELPTMDSASDAGASGRHRVSETADVSDIAPSLSKKLQEYISLEAIPDYELSRRQRAGMTS